MIKWAIGGGCSICAGFLAGVVFDYVTSPLRSEATFAAWLGAVPASIVAPLIFAAIGVFWFVALRMAKSN